MTHIRRYRKMTEPITVSAAQALLEAYDGEPIPPLTATYPGMTLDDAYEIQLQQVRHWTGSGRTVRGHKVGLTSVAMQRQLGVDQPDYGHLTDDMFHLESQPISVERFLSPKVEPEIAFVLKSALAGPGVTVADAISAIDYALPALEIIDSRIRDWKITLADTVADNASSAGVVLGSTPVTLNQLTQSGYSLRTVGCTLYQSGRVVGTGAGGAALGSPLNALVWLANTVGVRGVALEAGAVVLPGSVTAAVPVAAGQSVTAHFAGLGTVTAAFASSSASAEK
ncbi:2-keto-4-pentenoate hydratase [Nocardia africana]